MVDLFFDYIKNTKMKNQNLAYFKFNFSEPVFIIQIS